MVNNITMNHIHQQSRYSLFHLCGNKRDHQTQTGGNADGDAETGGLSKPSDNRWSYQETEEADARNDGDARLNFGDAITDPRIKASKVKYWGFLQDWLGITPYVYGVSGRQRNDIPRQVGCMGCGL